MTVGIAIVTWIALPSSFTIFNFGTQKVVQSCNCSSALVLACGLVLLLGLSQSTILAMLTARTRCC
nr:pyrophosphate-energized vacuolar membrane proton pump-like [Ipomoea batatas]GMD81528.1 pyrophosphate-energized vacuolar membrane proton pump-like [Ipomoea batatas]